MILCLILFQVNSPHSVSFFSSLSRISTRATSHTTQRQFQATQRQFRSRACKCVICRCRIFTIYNSRTSWSAAAAPSTPTPPRAVAFCALRPPSLRQTPCTFFSGKETQQVAPAARARHPRDTNNTRHPRDTNNTRHPRDTNNTARKQRHEHHAACKQRHMPNLLLRPTRGAASGKQRPHEGVGALAEPTRSAAFDAVSAGKRERESAECPLWTERLRVSRKSKGFSAK